MLKTKKKYKSIFRNTQSIYNMNMKTSNWAKKKSRLHFKQNHDVILRYSIKRSK